MNKVVGLPSLVAHRAVTSPNSIFVEHADDGGSLTYLQVDALAKRWAYAMARQGIHAGDTVLTMLPPSFDAIAAWLGAAWLKAIEVPINTAYRGRMLNHVIDDSQATCLIVHAEFAEIALGDLSDGALIDTVVIVGGPAPAHPQVTSVDVDTFLRDAPAVALADPHGRDIAAIIYTSGTTGPSKGVLVPWAQAEVTATGIAPSELFGEDDAFYSPFPMYHMSGKGPLLAMALVGGRVVLKRRFDTTAFWDDVNTHQVTTTILLGAMVNFLTGQPATPSDADTPLRDVLMLPLADDVPSFESRFGVRARTTFNMTETACCILSDGYALANEKSCGRVRPGFEARIVDQHDNEVGPGELGELVLRSDEPWTLMAGYWGNPEATASTWRNQWLHTGDGFTRDPEGNFYFVDRIKDAIRRRGENISSAEVEADVNCHPAVLESAAIAVPAEDSEDEIKVVVVVKPGESLAPSELAAYLQERMPRFMVPRYIEIVGSLPKTPTQKIKKAELRKLGVTSTTFDRAASRPRSHNPV
ncbi:dicarboxylate-CoA ligase PimA [Rhodococcus opacus PD630]|uniref:AMP-binding protein n=1 Tax=Rhodococcus opacus TaxID=37919 RepID=UPI00029CB332|nr:AMP-binding protein [Rhodococcus opacus]AHK36177.1 putative crotonobetaine/carnitine-CoA ligase [Rhodococcus opacus PD630]EHI43657.1 dicarboxylate-CoA ligase PimA [Rhodococcus opacus PD630]UDH01221.1 AMP-binding protein [Rhodococcus opacus PD630]